MDSMTVYGNGSVMLAKISSDSLRFPSAFAVFAVFGLCVCIHTERIRYLIFAQPAVCDSPCSANSLTIPHQNQRILFRCPFSYREHRWNEEAAANTADSALFLFSSFSRFSRLFRSFTGLRDMVLFMAMRTQQYIIIIFNTFINLYCEWFIERARASTRAQTHKPQTRTHGGR